MKDENYMTQAIKLAIKGKGYVNPNPLVGAVIVKDGEIIGTGYHEKYGSLHAERNALKNCISSPSGGTMYVTLEPCCHYGKTPPCTEAIIESGIKKVFIGSRDPNPKVMGKGIASLKEHGIDVIENFMKDECDAINSIFFHYIKTKTPYVTMKYAMTMDGKIATVTGKSKWISCEESRLDVQNDRHNLSAIMVGVGTVLVDDPLLTCRIQGGKNPIRVICDTNLRTPLSSRIVLTAKEVPTIIATSVSEESQLNLYRHRGCQLLVIPKKGDHIDLNFLMKSLGEMGIDSILLEGGSTLNWSCLSAGIVNKTKVYIAPKIFGGASAKGPIGGIGVSLPSESFMLSNSIISRIGTDLIVESEVKYPCLQE